MCEEKASQELAKLGGSFWEGGVEAVEKGVQDTPPEQDEVDEENWEAEIFATLDSLKSVAVLEGYVKVGLLLFLVLTAVIWSGLVQITHSMFHNFSSSLTEQNYYSKFFQPDSKMEHTLGPLLSSFHLLFSCQKDTNRDQPGTLPCADSLPTFVFSSKWLTYQFHHRLLKL